jgi:hypothetical protein
MQLEGNLPVAGGIGKAHGNSAQEKQDGDELKHVRSC